MFEEYVEMAKHWPKLFLNHYFLTKEPTNVHDVVREDILFIQWIYKFRKMNSVNKQTLFDYHVKTVIIRNY